jgi:hypothetical protein
MNKDAALTTTFKFLDAELIVRRIKADPRILIAHNETLSKGCFARYNLTRVKLKTFTFSGGPQSLSINNPVIVVLPKRLLITIVKNKGFLGSINTNSYNFRHYNLTNFTLFVNGKQIPSECLSLDLSHEETSVMGYTTLLNGSGIHHSSSGLQITQDMCIYGYFVTLQSDARSGSIGRTYIITRQWEYSDRT